MALNISREIGAKRNQGDQWTARAFEQIQSDNANLRSTITSLSTQIAALQTSATATTPTVTPSPTITTVSGVQVVYSGTGITITGASTSPRVNIADTGVTAGSYTAANITVNAQGQITAAASSNPSNRTFWQYTADTTATSGYPGDGDILWNNATQTSATAIIIAHITSDKLDIDIFLSYIASGDTLLIQDDNTSSNFQKWTVSGTPTNTNPGTSTSYWTVPVTLASSGGTGTTGFSNNQKIIVAYFGASGGGSGVSSLDGITGAITLVAGSNITITDNSPSAGNIKIAASSSGGGGLIGYITPSTLTPPNLSAWTPFNLNNITFTTNSGGAKWLYNPTVAGGVAVGGYYTAVPGTTPWSAILGYASMTGGNYNILPSLVLYESGTGKLINWEAGNNSAQQLIQILKWTNSTTFSASYFNQANLWFLPFYWLKVTNDGTNLTWYAGPDGQSWIPWQQTTLTNWFTTGPTHAGVSLRPNTVGGALLVHWSLG